MQELDDNTLLERYLDEDSEEAFATLVTRHINKVYSVALRHTRNPHQAEEITQAVFVILARKSWHLSKRVILSGWLYQTARLTAVTFIRSEIRRARREQEAHMQTLSNDAETDVWPQIAPLLDAAMAGLNEADRQAVVLRFFDGKSMKEVGMALGASEDAAKMRLGRAVEKLRGFFTKRGIFLSATALTAVISSNSVQAAPAVLVKTAAAAGFGSGATASGSTIVLVKGAMKVMAWAKAKNAISAGAGVVLVAGVVTLAVSVMLRAEPHGTPPAPAGTRIGLASDASPAPAASEQPQPNSPRMARIAAPQTLPAPLIYPNAPKFSEMMAARQSNAGQQGGPVVIPPELMIRNQFGNLFQKLQMTPDQTTAFIKIMEDKQSQEGAYMREHALDRTALQGLTRAEVAAAQQEHFQQIQAQLQPFEQAADAQIKELLENEHNYSYYQTYTNQQKERMILMNGYRQGLEVAGALPLTLDQVEQLVELASQSRIGAGNNSEVQAARFPQLLQDAANFLTPDQVEILAQYKSSLVNTVTSGRGGVIAVTAPRGN